MLLTKEQISEQMCKHAQKTEEKWSSWLNGDNA